MPTNQLHIARSNTLKQSRMQTGSLARVLTIDFAFNTRMNLQCCSETAIVDEKRNDLENRSERSTCTLLAVSFAAAGAGCSRSEIEASSVPLGHALDNGFITSF